MHLASIRVNDTEVLSFDYPRLDERTGAVILHLVNLAVQRGALDVVLDLGPSIVIDFAGARALRIAAEYLAGGGKLHVAGLSGRARATLRSLRVDQLLHLVEWWADAVEPCAQAA